MSNESGDVVALTCDLVARRSVTPDDAGCQDVVAQRLETAGFRIQRLRFGDVDNLWATHGSEGPVLVFLGHTDVVPSGPVGQWTSDPFTPTVRDGKLYGRGTADMKGSVAAFVVGLEQFAAAHPQHRGTVATACRTSRCRSRRCRAGRGRRPRQYPAQGICRRL